MSGFNNPVVGALNLIRRAIRSPNYAAGTAGWTVNQDGSAEFNDVVVRGEVDVGATGEPQVIIGQDTAGGFITLPTGDPAEQDPSTLVGATNAFDSPGKFGLLLKGPSRTDNSNRISLGLLASPSGGNPELVVADSIGILVALDATTVLVVPSFHTSGVLTAASMVYGSTTITPSAANTPTAKTITGLGLAGSTFTGQATAQTSVPGTTVTGVGVSAVNGDSITIVLTRTNTTATSIYYQAIGQ
jgi:hypothetical protein